MSKIALPKEDRGFALFFSAAILIFLWDVIFMKSSFLWGDNLVQFYPWLKEYSESIKQFRFPYWAKTMGGGFPLMAEGQIGGFYPLNILLFFLLPFHAAYNYSIAAHFILAGISTYLYARKMGADSWGSSLAAFLFCFGSAYAGGFCNIITLRTLAWFPLVLLLFESYFDKRAPRYVIFAGIILGMQLIAGFVQMAVYSFLFYSLYFWYRMKSEPAKAVFHFLLFVALAWFLFLPQFILTSQLMHYSGRQSLTLGFALWGSFPPFAVLGSLFPAWMKFVKSEFYIGVMSILFLISSFFMSKSRRNIRPLFLLLFVSFFLALGQYNPVYLFGVKIFKLYFFRNPSKFLFFGAFAASVLTGLGFSWFFGTERPEKRKSAVWIFVVYLCAGASAFILSKLLLSKYKDKILEFGRWYVTNFIYNKPHHRYSLDTYLSGAERLYGEIIRSMSLSNLYTLLSWVFVVSAIFFSLIIIVMRRNGMNPFARVLRASPAGECRRGTSPHTQLACWGWGSSKILKIAAFSVIFVDIFVYSFHGLGFGGNIKPFSALAPSHSKLLDLLKADKDIFRILPYDLKSGRLPSWAMPNANMIYAIESVGLYTPLAARDYKEKLNQLQAVDDSLGVLEPRENSLRDNLRLLKFLNVKYIVTPHEIKEDGVEFIEKEEGVYLYRVKDFSPRIFFVNELANPNQMEAHIEIIKYGSGYMSAAGVAPQDGFVVFSEYNYPGWQAYVDGKKSEILEFEDILQAVRLTKGRHEVVFEYNPWTIF